MATLAEMMFQSASQSAQKEPGIAEGVTKGIELAQKAEQIQQQRAQINAAKEANQTEKLKMFSDDIQKAKGLTGKAAQGYGKFLKAKRANLGLNDVFDDQTLDFITATPENLDRFIALKNNVRDGKLTLDEAIVKSKDPSQLLDIAPEMYDELYKASEGKIAATEAQRRAEAEARASLGKQMQAQEAAPVVEANKKVQDLFVAYEASGGKAGTESRIAKLKEIRGQLESGELKFGTFGKRLPYGGDLDVLARIDPKAKSAIDTVRSSINVKMRTGDPNPTENQINQIYNQAIDPRLSNEENIKKLNREILAEEKADDNARKQFSRIGRNVEAPVTSSALSNMPKEKRAAFDKLSPAAQQLVLKKLEGK